MLASNKFLNCFQYCAKALQILGSVMVLIVVGIVGFTYYAVVPATYGPMLRSSYILQVIGSLMVVTWFSVVVRRCSD
jgi:hypothetical protein